MAIDDEGRLDEATYRAELVRLLDEDGPDWEERLYALAARRPPLTPEQQAVVAAYQGVVAEAAAAYAGVEPHDIVDETDRPTIRPDHVVDASRAGATTITEAELVAFEQTARDEAQAEMDRDILRWLTALAPPPARPTTDGAADTSQKGPPSAAP